MDELYLALVPPEKCPERMALCTELQLYKLVTETNNIVRRLLYYEYL
jgi:hypothetical protein